MTFSLIDIGVNLTSSSFQDDSDTVVANANGSGVDIMILTGSDIEDSQAAATLCHQYPGCYSTAGIHPHYAKEFNAQSIENLRLLAKQDKVKAIGETGLDFNRNFSTPAQQLEAFEAQLSLACEVNMPVFLHQRDAHKEFHHLLKKYRDNLCDGVAHCFTDDKTALHAYLDLDLHIGITGWICDERRGKHLRTLVRDIPLDRLMLETDAPYLLPRTIRPKPKSRRNEPRYLPYVLSEVAACMELSEQVIAEATTATAKRFFGI